MHKAQTTPQMKFFGGKILIPQVLLIKVPVDAQNVNVKNIQNCLVLIMQSCVSHFGSYIRMTTSN